jgi:hypothetical protein
MNHFVLPTYSAFQITDRRLLPEDSVEMLATVKKPKQQAGRRGPQQI